MKRNIISIDREKCNGCGLCITACHEDAIQLIDGKAELISESYCDGLGDCLPACPTDAIHIEVREALEYDEEAVIERIKAKTPAAPAPQQSGCPGQRALRLGAQDNAPTNNVKTEPSVETDDGDREPKLGQWPCQLQLVPVNAPYFDGADILVAADCAAFAHGDFHRKYIDGKITLIACPKLDSADYATKLGAIFKNNDINTVTVVRMEVPCCGGLARSVYDAIDISGKGLPVKTVIIGVNGVVREA